MKVSVAAIGSVSNTGTFSGTPYHFWKTARDMGYDLAPWEMDLSRVNHLRKAWNAVQLLRLRKTGGFQYSETFANSVVRQIPRELLSSSVISFNQHFPPATVIQTNGGKTFHYIDATFSQLADRYRVGDIIDRRAVEEIKKKERDFFERTSHIFTMQQWARNSVIKDYNIDPSSVTFVLPGANIIFPDDHRVSQVTTTFHKERPLVLGFVGKDWRRKGLPLLAAVRDELERRGHNVIIRCAGYAPPEFVNKKGIEFTGFIDKNNNYASFIRFLESCDIGCLFSEAEFSSISVLEFISVGRPVAGFVVDGMGDLFIPETSLRFMPSDSMTMIADNFEMFITNQQYRDALNKAAVAKSEYVRWNRSVKEVMKIVLS